MSSVRKTCAVFVLVALAWMVEPVAEAQPPIRIGASLAQTGGFAALGQVQLRGYKLCVKHINDKGGVPGRKLELVLYDDDSDPATAVRLCGFRVDRDGLQIPHKIVLPIAGSTAHA